jgi:drug/metabolite transporter (DMT)-like permease
MRPVLLATLSAVLFGVSTPASKLLLRELSPQQLAGLLYLGAALAVLPVQLRTGRLAPFSRLDSASAWRLGVAIACGGVLAPLALLFALRFAAASDVSLLLNLELAVTALLGVCFFHESLGSRGRIGIAVLLFASMSLATDRGWPGIGAALLAAAACAGWGLDNQLTALVDGVSPAGTTLLKGLAAGAFNLGLGFALGPWHGSLLAIASALALGGISYGLSLMLHISASQQLGPTRTQAIFASAPFAGALAALLFLGEPASAGLALAALALAVGVLLLLSDRHQHAHRHGAIEHVHAHRHDDGHHLHTHPGLAASVRHTHWHRHEPLEHAHPHISDLHHRHEHDDAR